MSLNLDQENLVISVFAPVSIGNVSVGFDNLGLAVNPIDGQLLGDIVQISPSNDDQNHLNCKGSYQSILPENKEENIIWHCLIEFNQQYEKIGGKIQAVQLTLIKDIPICSGMGSSACSVVAGLMALNEFYDMPFQQNQLLAMMGKLEGQISGGVHYDNVAPCYLGGLQLMIGLEDSISQSVPVFEECYWVISYPDIKVSTRMAREILPKEYPIKDVIDSARLLAGFIDASHRQDKKQAFELLKDIIAEPYRKSLLNNFQQTKEQLLANSCLSVGISGSGPTVFAVCDNLETAEKAKQIFSSTYSQTERSFTHICKVDTQGARRVSL